MERFGMVRRSDRVADYFSDQAANYQARSKHFPWAWIRLHELEAVQSLLGEVTGLDILELGVGTGFYARELIRQDARQIWAVDISKTMLATLPEGPIVPILGDAATVRLNRSFPVLVSTGMLEFVADPVAILANAARHAEPGARFVILAPRANALGYIYRGFHRAHGIKVHLFHRNWFEWSAPRAGWHVQSLSQILPFSIVVRLHRVS
jgi:SAM-dependent methyltransferase